MSFVWGASIAWAGFWAGVAFRMFATRRAAAAVQTPDPTVIAVGSEIVGAIARFRRLRSYCGQTADVTVQSIYHDDRGCVRITVEAAEAAE